MKDRKDLTVAAAIVLLSLPLAGHAQDRHEAEAASYSKCEMMYDNQYSGGKALRLTDPAARITFTIPIESKGRYTIRVAGDGVGGDKVINCSVNGATSQFHLNSYGEVEVGNLFLNAGENKIIITPNWTWFDIDYLSLEGYNQTLTFDISDSPVDAEATPAAREMYTFLLDNFGNHVVSGIMTGDMATANGDVTRHADVDAVYRVSGKRPALIGFDFMNATGKNSSNSYYKSYTRSAVDLAKDTYRRGGIPAFTWHWRDPSRATDAFYTDQSSVHISQAMTSSGAWNENSTLYRQMVSDIHTIADFFLELQAEGMACVFRPLHEASGGWFWWGRDGARYFRPLFQLIYHEMVEVKGVHNVLWIWNAGTEDQDWDPGQQYYDVVSADIYNNDYDYSSNYPTFDKLKALTEGKKIVALSENGPIPDIDLMADEDAMWSWWMPWYQTWNGGFVNKTRSEEWKKCMNDPRVITLEDREGGWSAQSGIDEITEEAPQRSFDLWGRSGCSDDRMRLYVVGRKCILMLR